MQVRRNSLRFSVAPRVCVLLQGGLSSVVFGGHHGKSLSRPVLEWLVPADINERGDNNYFSQQSHIERKVGRRLRAKAILIFALGRRRVSLRQGRSHAWPLGWWMAFHQDHVCPRSAMAHFSGLAVFLTVQPRFGALR